MSETSGSANSVQVGLCHFREIEINNNIHSLYIDTSREEIRADQVPAQPGSEVMENAISMCLLHLGMDVVTAVAKLGNLFRQQFDTLCRIAEDDRLVDLELGKQGVKAVHLLPLLDERVVLCDTLQGELLHQVDLVWLAQMLFHEVLHAQWECRREQQNLALFWQFHYDMIQHALEVLRQQFVRFV